MLTANDIVTAQDALTAAIQALAQRAADQAVSQTQLQAIVDAATSQTAAVNAILPTPQ